MENRIFFKKNLRILTYNQILCLDIFYDYYENVVNLYYNSLLNYFVQDWKVLPKPQCHSFTRRI